MIAAGSYSNVKLGVPNGWIVPILGVSPGGSVTNGVNPSNCKKKKKISILNLFRLSTVFLGRYDILMRCIWIAL